jgi:hypothetical protein
MNRSDCRVSTTVATPAETIETQGTPEWVNLMARSKAPLALDSHFTNRESEILISHIRGICAQKGWTVYWNPARDNDRPSAIGYFDRQS